jgi:hypothetical protein
MHPNQFRLLVLLSFLISAANAALGFTFDNIEVQTVDGGIFLTPTAVGFGIVMVLHGFLFFFWNPSRYILAILLAVFVAVAYLGIWPQPEDLTQLTIGMVVLTAIVGGAMTAVAFSGDISERFKRS